MGSILLRVGVGERDIHHGAFAMFNDDGTREDLGRLNSASTILIRLRLGLARSL